jgi:DNA polymerase-1
MRPIPDALPYGPDVAWLIDLTSIARTFFHACEPSYAPTGEPTHATIGTLDLLVRLMLLRAPRYLAAAVDREDRDTFRLELWPQYKAKRPPRPAEFQVQLDRLVTLLRLHRIPVYNAPHYEADDGIATAVRIARGLGLRVVVVSRDLDLAQLVADDVWLWNGAVGQSARVPTPASVEAEFGVKAERLGDLFALAGDPSDGVPGVPLVGEKVAAEWLLRFETLDAVLRLGPTWLKPGTRQRNLKAHVEQVRMYRELVGLIDRAPIGFDAAEFAVGGFDVSALREAYNALGFAENERTAAWLNVTHFPKAPVPWTEEQVKAVADGVEPTLPMPLPSMSPA